MQGQNHDTDNSFHQIKRYGLVLWRKWYWLAASLAIALLVAFYITQQAEPVYQIGASVLIKDPNKMSNSVKDILYGGEDLLKGTNPVDNEAFLIRRFELVHNTLDELDYETIVYYDESPVEIELDTNSAYIPDGTAFELTFIDQNRFTLSTKNEDLQEYVEEQTFEFGETINMDGFRISLKMIPPAYNRYRQQQAESEEEEPLVFQVNDLELMADRYINAMEVEPVDEKATIMQLTMETTWPEKEIRFLNALTTNYLESGLQEKVSTATQTMNFLDQQLRYISDSLSSIEDVRETFKETNTIDLSKEGDQLYEEIQELEKERGQYEIQLEYLNYLKSYVNNEGNDFEYVTVPSSLGVEDPVLNSLINELVKEQMKLKQYKTSTRGNPAAKLVREKIDNIRRNILETVNNLINGNQIALRDLQQKLGRYSSELKQLPGAERELIDIERKYNLSETLYLFLMEKKTESGIIKASTRPDFKIVNRARIKNGGEPIAPKPLINYASAVVLGLLIPIMLIYVGDKMNDKLRTPEELYSMTNIPLLGMIGQSKEGNELVAKNGSSPIAESFRTIRSNLRYMGMGDKAPSVFMLSSYVSGEGKTFCAKNLAYMFAIAGKKTVYVNTDLRKNNSYEEFEMDKTTGITEYLIDAIPVKGVIHTTKFKNLYVVPSGKVPPNPAELLMTDRFKEMLHYLKEEFDYVILDTPPRGILADAMELLEFADVEIFVMRQDVTLRENVAALDRMYHNAPAQHKSMGIIFNGVNFAKIRYSVGKYPMAYSYVKEK
ncbi:MAG: GumC family protein [Cyclobacteriaceae bacterium]